jgi:hypothetical protein
MSHFSHYFYNVVPVGLPCCAAELHGDMTQADGAWDVVLTAANAHACKGHPPTQATSNKHIARAPASAVHMGRVMPCEPIWGWAGGPCCSSMCKFLTPARPTTCDATLATPDEGGIVHHRE